MTVAELKEHLSHYPDDMPVVIHSGKGVMDLNDVWPEGVFRDINSDPFGPHTLSEDWHIQQHREDKEDDEPGPETVCLYLPTIVTKGAIRITDLDIKK